jgi:lanosterol synthase
MARKQANAPKDASASDKPSDARTDYARWRLLDDRGRQTWHYLKTDKELKEWPQSIADKYHLGLPTVC